ncbi:MAG TPA: DHA2 family efflux MFS transporter permease subunit [Bryobacteraceae bacterium]|jgi:DHA2 family multidrug resistance protein|nr:DHA2 family efflux MFS transporter permease subunit [Bryobacteraceae bacterium]
MQPQVLDIAAAPEKPAINPWVIAGVVMLATFMEVLDTSVANVALPHIAGSLASTPDESTWVLTAYLVANAIVLPLSGWFSTLFGRKRFYMTCVLLFTISSAMCGLAPSLGMLILFRVLQGLGGGALQPVSQAILRETFPREKQGMAMAVYGMGVVLAPVVGPTLGGWITDNYTWRWIFLINIPVGICSLLFTSLLIFDPPYLVRKTLKDGLKIDYIGLGLLAAGLGALEITLDEGQRNDWFSSGAIVASTIIAVVALISVVLWELRQKDPVVDFHLLKDRNFAISTLTMFMLGFVLYGSTMALPLFLQTLLGYTAMQSGMALSPGGLAILVMMPIVGFLLSKFEARWLVIFGLLISSYGLFQMTDFDLNIDFRHAVMARIVQSLGLAFLFVPINTMAFYFIAKQNTSYATGLINLARNMGGSTGIAISTTLVARREQFHQQRLIESLTPLNGAYQSTLESAKQMFMSKGADAVDAGRQAQQMIYNMVQRQATLLSFLEDFRLLALTFLAVIPLMLLMKRIRPKKTEMLVE